MIMVLNVWKNEGIIRFFGCRYPIFQTNPSISSIASLDFFGWSPCFSFSFRSWHVWLMWVRLAKKICWNMLKHVKHVETFAGHAWSCYVDIFGLLVTIMSISDPNSSMDVRLSAWVLHHAIQQFGYQPTKGSKGGSLTWLCGSIINRLYIYIIAYIYIYINIKTWP